MLVSGMKSAEIRPMLLATLSKHAARIKLLLIQTDRGVYLLCQIRHFDCKQG